MSYFKKKIIESYINNSKLHSKVYPLFIDYSTVSFILYFTKSTLTVLNNNDNTHACIKYIKIDWQLQNENDIYIKTR